MILHPKQTTIAYRCPSCGTTVVSLVGAFSLTADMIRLKCPCGESALSIVYTKDNRIRLSVPCFLCPRPHNFQLSSQLFFSTELMTFPCPYSGVDICFVGKQDAVERALREADESLKSMIGDTDITTLSTEQDRADLFSDPQILDIVMYVIHELQAEGEIHCRCPEQEGDYTVEIRQDCVHLECKNCGAQKDIQTDSLFSANAFLHCTHIDLE